jgi:hypothetical protein
LQDPAFWSMINQLPPLLITASGLLWPLIMILWE